MIVFPFILSYSIRFFIQQSNHFFVIHNRFSETSFYRLEGFQFLLTWYFCIILVLLLDITSKPYWHTGIARLQTQVFDAGLWTLDPAIWTFNSGLQTLKLSNFKNCPKLWKQWKYINYLILEFFIDKNLLSFQISKIHLRFTDFKLMLSFYPPKKY